MYLGYLKTDEMLKKKGFLNDKKFSKNPNKRQQEKQKEQINIEKKPVPTKLNSKLIEELKKTAEKTSKTGEFVPEDYLDLVRFLVLFLSSNCV